MSRSDAAPAPRRRFVALAPDDSLRDAEALMRMGRFRALPVVSGDRLEGMLHYASTARWCLSAGALAGRCLRETRVAALMDAQASSVRPGISAGEVAARLIESQADCVPVVDGAGILVGIVTERDLLREAFVASSRGG